MRSALAFALLVASGIVVAGEPHHRAGFAAVAITPAEPMWMSGYAARTAPAEGKEHDLFARAAFFDVGEKRLLVSLDLVGIDRDTSKAIVEAIQTRHNLPREAIVLACSHTHCGPVVGLNLRSAYFFNDSEADKVTKYTQALPGKVLEAVDAAAKNLQPVVLTRHNGTCGFAVNRRENKEADVIEARKTGAPLKGPSDHAVPVLAARDPQGTLKGLLFGYACHATTLAYMKWNGDYPGYAALNLEKDHPGAVALFVAGCGADQNPLPRRKLEQAVDYGAQLSKSVNDALAKPGRQVVESNAKATYAEIDLPLAKIPTKDEVLAEANGKDKYAAARAKILLAQIEKGGIPAAYPYSIQTWRLGDTTFVFLGGEVVVDYALRLKKELGDSLWPAGYCNDVMAYIPDERVLREGGYEGGGAMVYYGLPSAWKPGVEELIVKEVHRQAKGTK